MPDSGTQRWQSLGDRQSRRAFLGTTAAGMGVLGGCLGDDDDDDGVLGEDIDPDELEEELDEEIEEGDFVMPMYQNPEEVSYLIAFDGDRWYDFGVDYGWSDLLIGVMHEPAMYANWANAGESWYDAPDPHPPEWGLAEGLAYGDEWEDEPFGRPADELEGADRGWGWRIADDAVWSDGEPVTARDSVMQTLYSRQEGDGPWNRLEEGLEHKPVESWEQIHFPEGLDGKIVQFTDPWGAMDMRTPWGMWGEGLITGGGRTGNQGFWPTHKEPYAGIVEQALEQVERQIENPADEWINRGEFARQFADFDPEDWETWRDPDHVVGTGAWQLADIRGTQEIVYEPNDNWRHDPPEFDRLRLVYQESDERRAAEFMAGRIDVLEETLPYELWDQAPDKYDWQRGGGQEAYAIGLNHDDPHLEKRNVRAAINYALDKQEIAETIHPEMAEGVNVPAGQAWGVEDVDALSQDWIDENLVDYTADREYADELMEQEDYTREGNQWVGPDGDELSYVFYTDQDDPRLGLGISEQLSRWGIPVEIQTLDSATYTEQLEAGEFDMWRTGAGTGDIYSIRRNIWMHGSYDDDLEVYRIFDADKRSELLSRMRGENMVGDFHLWEEVGIGLDIPPIGEPYSDELMDGEPFDAPTHQHEGDFLTREDELFQWDEWWHKLWWTHNWFLPVIPVYHLFLQIWRNEEHDWSEAESGPVWDHFGETVFSWTYLGSNQIRPG